MKSFVVIAGIMTVTNSTLGSSIPSGAIDFIAKDFDVADEKQLVLPISVYLIGYVVGPSLCGPLSESFGRRVVLLSTFIVFASFTLGCALAPNWPTFLVFHWICGMAASVPIAVVPGKYADIYGDPRARGRAMSSFMAVSF